MTKRSRAEHQKPLAEKQCHPIHLQGPMHGHREEAGHESEKEQALQMCEGPKAKTPATVNLQSMNAHFCLQWVIRD